MLKEETSPMRCIGHQISNKTTADRFVVLNIKFLIPCMQKQGNDIVLYVCGMSTILDLIT
jgi:hypothetical protein